MTRCSRIDALKTKCAQVEFIDENVDHSHWIFFGYVIVQTLRQQGGLPTSLTFNESLHDRPRHDLDDQKIRQLQVFSHSLGRLQPIVTDSNRPTAVLYAEVRFAGRCTWHQLD